MKWKDPPLEGTRFGYPAPKMSYKQQLVEVEEMRLLIRAMVYERLSAHPLIIVIEPHVAVQQRMTWRVRDTLPTAEVRTYQSPDFERLYGLDDVWAVIVAIDVEGYDVVSSYEFLTRHFDEAKLIARAGMFEITPREPLWELNLTTVIKEGEIDQKLGGVLIDLACARESFPARQAHKLLKKQVVHRFGEDALERFGMERPFYTCPTMREVERETIKRALLVADGARPRAAELLGISIATIYRRQADYELEDYCARPRRRPTDV